MNDTIAAISTATGVGAISIVRVSGIDAISIVNKIFCGKNLEEVPTHTIHYGKIIDKDEIIDEVLVSVMKSPKTFTTEDVVEINCHGGIITTKRVLELVLINGCRLAEPGEFTKRAYLNGRIDLNEAEGIMNLIEAKTDIQRKLAINEVSGKVSKMITELRNNYLVDIIANIEVNADYPEYDDIEIITNEMIDSRMKELETKIKEIIKSSEEGKIIKEGIKTSIIGKPNVGKSSLLNNLLEEEKAIVTDIEGTTRDIVEGTINVNGILLNIIDTAGIRETDNLVEKIGVQRSIELIDKSDLILFVLNNNDIITEEELIIYERIKEKNHIVVINKIDLENNLDISFFKNSEIIKMSNLNQLGIEELKNKIIEIYHLEKIEQNDLTYLTNARSISILKQILNEIDEIKKGLLENRPTDILGINLKNIWNMLGTINGDVYEDELIDYLFSHFCLGK
jgi:tRNA modification GTPase